MYLSLYLDTVLTHRFTMIKCWTHRCSLSSHPSVQRLCFVIGREDVDIRGLIISIHPEDVSVIGAAAADIQRTFTRIILSVTVVYGSHMKNMKTAYSCTVVTLFLFLECSDHKLNNTITA